LRRAGRRRSAGGAVVGAWLAYGCHQVACAVQGDRDGGDTAGEGSSGALVGFGYPGTEKRRGPPGPHNLRTADPRRDTKSRLTQLSEIQVQLIVIGCSRACVTWFPA
jgi:hypothetical protein